MRALARFALNLKDRRVFQHMVCTSSAWESAAKELTNSLQVHRHLSTRREPPASDFLCSKRAKNFISNLEVKTKDFTDGYGSSEQLQSDIDASIKENDQRYKKEVLESMYHELVRPELVSRMLIHDHKFDDPCTHWLAYQTHGRTKKKPRFISSYDLMVHLVDLLEEHWVFFLNYLADERIAVVEEWISICTIQHLMYDHGLKDFGSDIHFYKGECDASYFQALGEGESEKFKGKADLATIIWDNNQVLSSLTYRGVGSNSTQEAEAKAAFALLNKAKELKLEHFVLWTDSRTVWGILSGTRPIDQKEKGVDTFMALKSMRTSFKMLVPVHVPREIMTFSDGMLRKTALKYPRYQKKSAEEWAYYLHGLPVFRLTHTQEAQKILNTGKPVPGKPVHGETRAQKYYVEVAPDKKISALLNLTRALNASRVYLAVHDVQSKPEQVRSDLEEIIGNTVLTHQAPWSVLCNEAQRDEKNGSVLIVFDGICPSNLMNHRVDMVIILASEKDRQALKRIQAKELSASSWIHFKGVLPPPGRTVP